MNCQHATVLITHSVWVSVCLMIVGCLADEHDGYAKLENEIAELKAEIEKLRSVQRVTRSEINSAKVNRANEYVSGTNYIHWGRITCEGDAVTVYRGHAAGPHFHKSGGGSNMLCLHARPEWNRYVSGSAGWAGRIYGAEYRQYADNTIFSFSNHGGQTVHGFPAPCAACYVPHSSSVMMIPARRSCPSGWVKQYEGYIMSEAMVALPGLSFHRSQYLCWDGAPEVASGGTGQSQNVLYPVEVECGSLPCSMYIGGRELTCVVCTK